MSEVKTLDQAVALLAKYEENGSAKLYYALSRKAWEIGDLLNSLNYRDIDLDDAKSKTFERLQKLCESATKIAESVKALEGIAGITGNEKKDIQRKPISAQSIAKGEYVFTD